MSANMKKRLHNIMYLFTSSKSALMRSTTLLFSLTSLSLVSSTTHAESGWTNYAPVDELNPTARHYYVFRLNVDDNPSKCKVDSWFFQDYSNTGADQMFQTLLEALTKDAKVRVYVTGRCNLDGYSEISSVSIVR